MAVTNAFDLAPTPPMVHAVPADDNMYYDNDSYASATAVQQIMSPSTPVEQLPGVPIVPLDDDDDRMPEDERVQRLTVSAGVAGGIFGLLLGGPFLGLLAGFGTAYATKQQGATGECARAVGEVALEAKKKAQELNHKHDLVQKGQERASEAWNKVKEVDREHNLLERTKHFFVWSFETAKEQNRKHHLLERGVHAAGTFFSFVVTKIQTAIKDDGEQTTAPPPANPNYTPRAPAQERQSHPVVVH